MNVVCLDLEGVLVPEIWIAFAEATDIPELTRTTRDEPDYDKLMRYRIDILAEHKLGLAEIQEVIATIDPMPGAREFLDALKPLTQTIIISDTFSQFAKPLMEKLGWPTIFCNELVVDDNGMITGYEMRCPETKLTTVRDHRLGRLLQRRRHDPRLEGGVLVPHDRCAEGRIPRRARVRDLRRAAGCHHLGAVARSYRSTKPNLRRTRAIRDRMGPAATKSVTAVASACMAFTGTPAR